MKTELYLSAITLSKYTLNTIENVSGIKYFGILMHHNYLVTCGREDQSNGL